MSLTKLDIDRFISTLRTKSKETLDDLAENLKLIVDDLQKDDTVLEDYPKNLPVGRPNELIPAKYLTVNWGDFELLEITE